jgi:hypothetical protein
MAGTAGMEAENDIDFLINFKVIGWLWYNLAGLVVEIAGKH